MLWARPWAFQRTNNERCLEIFDATRLVEKPKSYAASSGKCPPLLYTRRCRRACTADRRSCCYEPVLARLQPLAHILQYMNPARSSEILVPETMTFISIAAVGNAGQHLAKVGTKTHRTTFECSLPSFPALIGSCAALAQYSLSFTITPLWQLQNTN